MRSRRNRFCRPVVLTLAAVLLSTVMLGSIPGTAGASRVNPPFEYDRVQERFYRSSVDGAVLPYSVLVPSLPSSPPKRLGLAVCLHGFGGPSALPSSSYDINLLRENRLIMIQPWGRHFRSLYSDAVGGSPEPCLFDEFEGAAGWTPNPGQEGYWNVQSGCYVQLDTGNTWKQSRRNQSSGTNYTVSVDLGLLGNDPDGNSDVGVTFHGQPNGDCYAMTLAYRPGGNSLRFLKKVNGVWTTVKEQSVSLKDPVNNLKVIVFNGGPADPACCVEVHIDNVQQVFQYTQPGEDPTMSPYCEDSTFPSGDVGLISSGASHRFDNFRLQDELLYGETDILDCIAQFLEEFSVETAGTDFRVDPSRVYLSGVSMGGLGTWSIGLNRPDLFAALLPQQGVTDLGKAREWIAEQYPDDPTPPLPGQPQPCNDQDSHIMESVDGYIGRLSGGLLDTLLRQHSARYILENSLNTPLRISHREYDSLVPNVVDIANSNDDRLCIHWWYRHWLFGLLYFRYKYKVSGTLDLRPQPDYAQSDYVWQKLRSLPLNRCRPETSGYNAFTGAAPTTAHRLDPGRVDLWDSYDYSEALIYGGHAAPFPAQAWCDGLDEQAAYLTRVTTLYRDERFNPSDVAYKTYDNVHRGAWWLKIDISNPNSGQPGLARVHNCLRDSTPSNRVEAHVKNVGALTLDLVRMGMYTGTGIPLAITLDNNTAPEGEPVVNTCNSTTLRLVGHWNPGVSYSVKLNGATKAYSISGTTMTIEGVPSNPASSIVVTIPGGPGNLLANPGFEEGDGTTVPGWTSGNHTGGGRGFFEQAGVTSEDKKVFAHSGNRSVRLKDCEAGASPHVSYWYSTPVGVIPGNSYTASAFARTRVLSSKNRVFENGKYSDNPSYNSYAKVGLTWLDAGNREISTVMSDGIRGTTDWTPLSVTAVAPPGAAGAKVMLAWDNPDASGGSGSVFFDDASLRGPLSAQAPAVTSITPSSGNLNTVVEITNLSGSGFQPGATVSLTRGQKEISATNVTVVSGTMIACRFDLKGAEKGAYDVIVRNPDGQQGARAGAFTVTEPSPCGGGAGSAALAFGLVVGMLLLSGSGTLIKVLRKNRQV